MQYFEENMDPEKQPLLKSKEYYGQRFRPLTTDEVLNYHHEETWRRARFFLLSTFWAIIAMCIVIIVSILASAPPCNIDTGLDKEPMVTPVHLSLVPLVYNGKE